jgi:hypothetical protein
MNINKPMELERESYKMSVTKAFKDQKDKYGLDKDKREEYIYLKQKM